MSKWETDIYKIGKYRFEFSINPHWITGHDRSLRFGFGWNQDVKDGECFIWIDLGLINIDFHGWRGESYGNNI